MYVIHVLPEVFLLLRPLCRIVRVFPAAAIIFKDKTMTPFDGGKCMFHVLLAMDRYDIIHAREDVAAAWTKDFNRGAWITARDAYFVVGSDMMGPMGKELIPLADKPEAMKSRQEQNDVVTA